MITREVLRRTIDHLVGGEDASEESLAVLCRIVEHLTDAEIRAAGIFNRVELNRYSVDIDPKPFNKIQEKYRQIIDPNSGMRVSREIVVLHLDMIDMIVRSLDCVPDKELSHEEIIAIIAYFDVDKKLFLQHDVNSTLWLMIQRRDLEFTPDRRFKLVSEFFE